jgi:membrane protease YdiL (CAAX protease family)
LIANYSIPLTQLYFLEAIGFFALWLVLWLPFAIPYALKLKWQPFQPSLASQKLPLLGSLYLLAPLVLWGFCWWEGKTFADYGMPLQLSLFASLAWGVGLGSLGLIGWFVAQLWLGWLERSAIQLNLALLSQVLLLLGLGLGIGYVEELVFRGFLQNQLQAGLPLILATSLTNLIFALLHGVWEGKTVLPQLPGLWLMGMVLQIACWVDQGNLGLAWGLHAGWVWVLASFDSLGLLHYTGKAPTWVTGAGQPLAGLVGPLFLVSTAVVLWLYKGWTI